MGHIKAYPLCDRNDFMDIDSVRLPLSFGTMIIPQAPPQPVVRETSAYAPPNPSHTGANTHT